MEWELIGETVKDHQYETLLFQLQNTQTEEIKVCGVTQIAINDYFRTDDTFEQAEANFIAHSELVIDLAVELIEHGLVNDRGQFVVTSDVFGT